MKTAANDDTPAPGTMFLVRDYEARQRSFMAACRLVDAACKRGAAMERAGVKPNKAWALGGMALAHRRALKARRERDTAADRLAAFFSSLRRGQRWP